MFDTPHTPAARGRLVSSRLVSSSWVTAGSCLGRWLRSTSMNPPRCQAPGRGRNPEGSDGACGAYGAPWHRIASLLHTHLPPPLILPLYFIYIYISISQLLSCFTQHRICYPRCRSSRNSGVTGVQSARTFSENRVLSLLPLFHVRSRNSDAGSDTCTM